MYCTSSCSCCGESFCCLEFLTCRGVKQATRERLSPVDMNQARTIQSIRFSHPRNDPLEHHGIAGTGRRVGVKRPPSALYVRGVSHRSRVLYDSMELGPTLNQPPSSTT
jgi:hypothetical protein